MSHTTTLNELLAAVFLGVSAAGLVAIPALPGADAHRSDFDPRPALARALESGRLDALLIAVGPALHAARTTTRRLLLVALQLCDRALLASARRLNTPKGTR